MASCSPSFSATGWTCPVNAPELLSAPLDAGTGRSSWIAHALLSITRIDHIDGPGMGHGWRVVTANRPPR